MGFLENVGQFSPGNSMILLDQCRDFPRKFVVFLRILSSRWVG